MDTFPSTITRKSGMDPFPIRSHERDPKLFQIARPFTWDRITHLIAKITADFVEKHLVVEGKSSGGHFHRKVKGMLVVSFRV